MYDMDIHIFKYVNIYIHIYIYIYVDALHTVTAATRGLSFVVGDTY